MIEGRHDRLTLLHFERLSKFPDVVHALTTPAPEHGPASRRWTGSVRCLAAIASATSCGLTSTPSPRPRRSMGADVLRVEPGDIGCGRDGRGSGRAQRGRAC